jgi:tRNA pseudouridine synthase 10
MGCRRCDNTGQLYPDSVQSLIANSFSRESLCTEDLFHGMGREDIDAAMLGDGRPFVLELRMPKVRDLNLEGLGKEINEANKDRIKVSNLRFVDRPRVAELKNTVCDKSYRVDISVSDITSIESLKKGSQRLTGTVIEQRTPTRVSHRRADLVRPRLINSVDVVSFEDNMVELVIRAQHGTYIRELVSGDKGRTVPSLSSLIDANCKVEVLDVLNLHLEAKEEKND